MLSTGDQQNASGHDWIDLNQSEQRAIWHFSDIHLGCLWKCLKGPSCESLYRHYIKPIKYIFDEWFWLAGPRTGRQGGGPDTFATANKKINHECLFRLNVVIMKRKCNTNYFITESIFDCGEQKRQYHETQTMGWLQIVDYRHYLRYYNAKRGCLHFAICCYMMWLFAVIWCCYLAVSVEGMELKPLTSQPIISSAYT